MDVGTNFEAGPLMRDDIDVGLSKPKEKPDLCLHL